MEKPSVAQHPALSTQLDTKQPPFLTVSFGLLQRSKHACTDQTYLHGAVEEAAVLARLVQQSFGGGQGQHAPRLVGFPQIAPGPPEELDPCHWIKGSACGRAGQ